MRKSVRLWDATRSRDEGRLRQIWEKEKGFYNLMHGTIPSDQTSTPAANFVLDAITSGIPPEGGQRDFLQSAAWMLQFPINKRLREETNVTLAYSHEEGRQRMYILPKNLIGAMWLQFAQALVYRKLKHPSCKVKIFQSPKLHRS